MPQDNNYNVSCELCLHEAGEVGESRRSPEIAESVDRRCSRLGLEDGLSEGICGLTSLLAPFRGFLLHICDSSYILDAFVYSMP